LVKKKVFQNCVDQKQILMEKYLDFLLLPDVIFDYQRNNPVFVEIYWETPCFLKKIDIYMLFSFEIFLQNSIKFNKIHNKFNKIS